MSSCPSRWPTLVLLATCALPIAAQTPPPPVQDETHDISGVETAPIDGAIAVPLPPSQQRRLKKYEIPELAGARQAIGSQLIDGALPRPVLDYVVRNGVVEQRLSFFEGGLVYLRMNGAGGTIRKKVVLPPDAVEAYTKNLTAESLERVEKSDLHTPMPDHRAVLRAFRADHSWTEREFDPIVALPKTMSDWVLPLQDLLRALSEDRTVTNSVANYEPKVGDRLVGDDRKTWEVTRIIAESQMVVLKCITEPTTIFVGKKDLYNYFIGSRRAAASQ